MKWDITVVEVDGNGQFEFIVGEQTKEAVLKVLSSGVNDGDGHEVVS